MNSITIVLTTRHRNQDAVEKDCYQIADCVSPFTDKYKFIYNGKQVIVFHVYPACKRDRLTIIATIIGRILSDTCFNSLDLQSYTYN